MIHARHVTAMLHGIGDDPVAIHLVPDVFGLASLRGGVEELETVPFIHLRESPLYVWNRVLKRVFDLVTSIERRIECDLYYIERWSLAFDLRILIQTLWYGIRNRNAY